MVRQTLKEAEKALREAVWQSLHLNSSGLFTKSDDGDLLVPEVTKQMENCRQHGLSDKEILEIILEVVEESTSKA